jgi:bifunctional DNase/RNase
MAVGGIAPTSDGNAVVLMDDTAHRGLMLAVGSAEAQSISLHLEQRKRSGALIHDLLDSVVKKLGGDVTGVRVDRLEDSTFYGSLLINKDGHVLEVDARPSEAIALALGEGVPVYVAEGVLAQAGIVVEKFDFRKLRATPEVPRIMSMRPGETEL